MSVRVAKNVEDTAAHERMSTINTHRQVVHPVQSKIADEHCTAHNLQSVRFRLILVYKQGVKGATVRSKLMHARTCSGQWLTVYAVLLKR